MKTLATLAFAAGLSLAGLTGAQAAQSMSVPQGSGIELVRDGCGRDGFRNRNGRCRPLYVQQGNGYGRGGGICPGGFRPTPRGCVRF